MGANPGAIPRRYTVGMSATHLVSVAEYLATSYRPDCDYVDGVVEERNLGEFDHSRLQALIVATLMQSEKTYGYYTVAEQRVQVKPGRFRIPDVCLIRKVDREQIITRPPLLCIEILSPEDTHSRLVTRLDDYLAMGVPECWVVDPKVRRGYTYTSAGLLVAQDAILRLHGTTLEVNLSDLFAQL